MPVFQFIKVISTILLTSALGLELWNFLTGFFNTANLHWLNWVVIIERLAIAIHGAEALIASCYARLKNQHPLQYGIYTFFVGTVGVIYQKETNTMEEEWPQLKKLREKKVGWKDIK